MRGLRPLAATPLLASLLAGCGGDRITGRCTPTGLAIVLQGTLQQDGVSSPIIFANTYSTESVSGAFPRLSQTLLQGVTTGSGTSVWRIMATALDITLEFQFGGSAAAGTSVSISGVPPQGLAEGVGPAFSAVGATGLFLGLTIGPQSATTAVGTLLVAYQAPLSGHLTAAFGFPNGSIAAVDGSLTVTQASANCPE